MFLSREQLEEMTGYKNHGKQAEWLVYNGYEFERRVVGGFPRVEIDEVRSRQLTYVRRPTRPDFS